MKFYTDQHQHYCGIDLHARQMYVCILDAAARCASRATWSAPRRRCWPRSSCSGTTGGGRGVYVRLGHWVADVCAREGIAFVLGHALYMGAIHGGKAKNDKLDAHKIAGLLRGGMLAKAYVYPRRCARPATCCAGAVTW